MSHPANTPLNPSPGRCGEAPPWPLTQGDGPVFSEPWQAQAFAMTLQLHERGLFSWPEWAAALSAEIQAAAVADTQAPAHQSVDDGSVYYSHWLNALEKLVIAKQIGSPEQIHALEHAWQAAAERTPHGQAIVLDPADWR